MHVFRRAAARRLLSFLLAFALAVSLGEEGIADVHDGDATHAELDRATGVSHATHLESKSSLDMVDRGQIPTPERSDHPVHVCHCTHAHLGLVAVSSPQVGTFEHSEPPVPGQVDIIPLVVLDLWTPPPII
jgi:hypothetical protein